jgi:hypothetical protein
VILVAILFIYRVKLVDLVQGQLWSIAEHLIVIIVMVVVRRCERHLVRGLREAVAWLLAFEEGPEEA